MDRSQSPRQQFDDGRKVFITNIDGLQSESAVETQLRRLFSRYGEVTKLNVKKNKNGLYSFAFLQFTKLQDASKAISQLDQYELFGKRMRVQKFIDKGAKIGKAKVVSTAKRVVILPESALKIKTKKENQDNPTTETDHQFETTETERIDMRKIDTINKIDIEKAITTEDIEMTEKIDIEDKGGAGIIHAVILKHTNVGREILAPNRDHNQEIVIVTTEVIHLDETVTTKSEGEIAVNLGINTTDVEEVTPHVMALRDDRFDGNVVGWSWFD